VASIQFFLLLVVNLASCSREQAAPPRKTEVGRKQGGGVSQSESNVAGLAQAWKKILGAMARRDEKIIRQLTTPAGLEALKRGVEGDHVMDFLERLGKGWQKCAIRWQRSEAPDRVECNVKPVTKESTVAFKRTEEGWKLDEWQPGM
jgi:hypothetical protein